MLNERLADTDFTGHLGSALLLSCLLIFKSWLGEGKPGAALELPWPAYPELNLTRCSVLGSPHPSPLLLLLPPPPPHPAMQAWRWRDLCTCFSCWAWLG